MEIDFVLQCNMIEFHCILHMLHYDRSTQYNFTGDSSVIPGG